MCNELLSYAYAVYAAQQKSMTWKALATALGVSHPFARSLFFKLTR